MWKPAEIARRRLVSLFYDDPLFGPGHILRYNDEIEWIENLLSKFNDVWWWLQHRLNPRHRYHIVNTGLGYGFHDSDTIIEAVIIKVLIDFVEIEKPFEHFDTEDSTHRDMWIRMRELYDFFKENNHLKMKHDELTPYLHEIVDMRDHFWT